jgi:hypothetical protein
MKKSSSRKIPDEICHKKVYREKISLQVEKWCGGVCHCHRADFLTTP